MTEDYNKTDDAETLPNEILCLSGIESGFIDHLNGIGVGFLMASQHGVDLAVKQLALAPTRLAENGHLWWPEAGIRLNPEAISGIFACKKSLIGAGSIEFDLHQKPNGFSISYIPDLFDPVKFGNLVDSFTVDTIKPKKLSEIRRHNTPAFNTCPHCKARGKRIRNDAENNPTYQIIQSLSEKKTQTEFHFATGFIDMLCSWKIDEVKHWHGEITAAGGDHVLRLDTTLIHTIQVLATTHRNKPASILRCYHLLGFVMIEIIAPGHQHASLWHKICSNKNSNYRALPGGPYTN